MARSKDLWIAEHERVLDEYADDSNRDKAVAALQALGFDQDQIQDELAAVDGVL